MSEKDGVNPRRLANAIRALAMDAVEQAKSGHPGMPMGMADVASVLFTRIMKYDVRCPNWPDRDRFVLSAGHGSMLQYAIHYLTGYEDMTRAELMNFRQFGARTAGHPEYGHALGIETTTGPLGQGLANGVGMALSERMLNARYGDDLVNHFTYVIAGDGCLMEGISHEAISFAGHMKLGRLIVLWDDNGISIDGPTSLAVSDNQKMRFEASGWDVMAIDGHDFQAIETTLKKAQITDKPTLIACKTTIGFGAPGKAGKSSSHGAPLGTEEIRGARLALDWPFPAFEIPDDILGEWREAGIRGFDMRLRWQECHKALDKDTRTAFDKGQHGELPEAWKACLATHTAQIRQNEPKTATRTASQDILNVLTQVIPEMIGGSADLTGSNNTRANIMSAVRHDDFSGSYLYYGVREHAMAAIMNGIALHGGFIPYGGTFLVFSDYCRPAMRLSALMGLRVIYVMTHDSIGLGEDGPTHQPVEHMAALRAIPHMRVMRPCDSLETAECWAIALEHKKGPTVLALTRQALPFVRTQDEGQENLSGYGGYVLRCAPGEAEKGGAEKKERQVTLIATGSEVEIALEAHEKLCRNGFEVAVVSMPCFELFAEQDVAYRKKVLGINTLRVGIEAGGRQGWDSLLGHDGIFVGMDGFGASAPYKDLYKHFGITAKAVVDLVTTHLQKT